MTMPEFWRGLSCKHERTTEPDERGDALCQDCGRSVRVVLTAAAFLETAAAMYRHPHRAACVSTDEGWICAPGCPLHRAAT